MSTSPFSVLIPVGHKRRSIGEPMLRELQRCVLQGQVESSDRSLLDACIWSFPQFEILAASWISIAQLTRDFFGCKRKSSPSDVHRRDLSDERQAPRPLRRVRRGRPEGG